MDALLLGPALLWSPCSSLVLRNIKASIILADTFTTILMPDAEGDGDSVETVPATSEVQLSLEGLSVHAHSFDPGEHWQRRIAIALHDMEVRDSVQAIGSGRPRAWRRMLGYHASATVPRDVDANLFSLVVDVQQDDHGAQ